MNDKAEQTETSSKKPKKSMIQRPAAKEKLEYDFLPAYLEVIEKPPAPWAKRTAMALISILILGLTWSILGEIDIHASAQGKVMISSHSKVIQAMEQGEITTIAVEDGQRVHRGEVLVQLNPVGADAETRSLNEKLMHHALESSRMQALLTNKPFQNFVIPEGAPSEKAMMTKKHLESEYMDLQAELKRLDAEKQVNVAELDAKKAQHNALLALSQNIRERLSAHRQLAQSKLLAPAQLLVQEKELLELNKQLKENQALQHVFETKIHSSEQQQKKLLAQKRLGWYEKLSQLDIDMQQIKQALIKAQERQRIQTLRSPVDGVVQQLAVHTLGGVVQPAQSLMVIVPEEAQLEAEVNILNKDIGFILKGQPVEIKIDSFPYTKYGTIKGEVMTVSRDAIEDEKLGLVFRARVKLHEHQIQVEDHYVDLNAGMSLQAEIRTGSRRVIEYLLSPLQQYQDEALRER